MLQQLINPIKLEAVTSLYICVAEQNILRTLSFRTQSKNEIIQVITEIYKTFFHYLV